MSKLIYNKTKSHGNKNNFLSSAGIDKIKINIPSGQKFTHFAISLGSRHTGIATFNVIKQPKAGATGNQVIEVMWTYGPFSRCHYKLRAYSKVTSSSSAQSETEILFGDNNWHQDFMSCLQQKMPISLIVKGPDALTLFHILNPLNNRILRRGIVINEPVSLGVTIAIVTAIMGSLALTTFGAVIALGIASGYTIDAEFDQNVDLLTGVLKHGIKFKLVPPSRNRN